MIRLSVMYPEGQGTRFDLDYYHKVHVPLIRKLLGGQLKGLWIDHGVAVPGMPATYQVVAHLLFETQDAFRAAMTDHAPQLGADIPNYTDIVPVRQVSETLDALQG